MKNILIIFFGTVLFSCGDRIFVGKKFVSVTDSTNKIRVRKHFDYPSPHAYWEKDSSMATMDYEDEGKEPLTLSGRFVDGVKDIRIKYFPNKLKIEFSEFKNGEWKSIAEFRNEYPIFFDFADMNGDGKKEIILRTGANMNGNYRITVFQYEDDTILKEADMWGWYRFDIQKQEVYEECVGSWYMPISRTLYKWVDQKLIPIRKITTGLKWPDEKNSEQFIQYYENQNNKIDGLRLVTEEIYDEYHWRHRAMWDQIFGDEK